MDLDYSLDHNYCQFSEESEEIYIATPISITLPQSASDEHGSPRNKKCKRICCVPHCHTTGYEVIEGHGKPSYHRFPPIGNPLREVWLQKIRRSEGEFFKVNSSTVVCSLHFPTDMTEVSGYGKRRCLLTGAVPTIFECWKDIKHIYKPTRTRPQNKMQINKTINLTEDDQMPQAVEINSESDTLSDLNKENVNPMTEIQTCEVELQNNYMIEHIKLLENKIAFLEQRQLKLVTDNQALQDDLNQSVFCVENLKPEEFPFYTGFQSQDVFNVVLGLLNPGENGENISVVQEKENVVRDVERKTRSRKLSPSNQFFLFLCRIKLGLFEMDLARRFNISVSTVSNIIISWANFCYLRLGTLIIWPSREMVDKSMPSSFKMKYPSTRAIIDCTEIKVNMPSSLLLKSQTYSNYKSTNTLKGLIGIAPCGSITFVSQLYHGSISDREITIRSGFLDLPFNEGDSLMADKGFDIQDLLDEKRVRLNIPPFLGKYGQMTDIEVFQTQSIAAERIHVERAINKIKNFHIFDQAIPVSLFGTINQIWTVCALLTLFQEPIISCPGSD